MRLRSCSLLFIRLRLLHLVCRRRRLCLLHVLIGAPREFDNYESGRVAAATRVQPDGGMQCTQRPVGGGELVRGVRTLVEQVCDGLHEEELVDSTCFSGAGLYRGGNEVDKNLAEGVFLGRRRPLAQGRGKRDLRRDDDRVALHLHAGTCTRAVRQFRTASRAHTPDLVWSVPGVRGLGHCRAREVRPIAVESACGGSLGKITMAPPA
mmetsp:Transcript_9865/g.24770  ORF Transcript_9865/g.24770 Transcript_9865/m.24770 type:complete len:208 (+) Transcript_9865:580-1203(+)